MRLKIDVYFDGESDFEDMMESISELARFLMTEHLPKLEEKESIDLVFPLGHIEISKEPNPVEPIECEDCNDNLPLYM